MSMQHRVWLFGPPYALEAPQMDWGIRMQPDGILGDQPFNQAFNRSDWEDRIISDMALRPAVSRAEAQVDDPESRSNRARRRKLTAEVVRRRVLAGYLLEDADKLEGVLDDLGGPLGSAAEVIHKTKRLSPKNVDKQVYAYLVDSSDGAIQPTKRSEALDMLLALFQRPESLILVSSVSLLAIVYLIALILTR